MSILPRCNFHLKFGNSTRGVFDFLECLIVNQRMVIHEMKRWSSLHKYDQLTSLILWIGSFIFNAGCAAVDHPVWLHMELFAPHYVGQQSFLLCKTTYSCYFFLPDISSVGHLLMSNTVYNLSLLCVHIYMFVVCFLLMLLNWVWCRWFNFSVYTIMFMFNLSLFNQNKDVSCHVFVCCLSFF